MKPDCSAARYFVLGRITRNVPTDASGRPAWGLTQQLYGGQITRTRRHFRSRFLLISSLSFRMSSNVLRGFAGALADVAVL
jgi:hypothetical protein